MVFLSFHNEDGDGDADNNKVDEDNDNNDDNGDDIDILYDDENVAHSRPSLVVAPHPATSTGLSPLKTSSLSTPPYLKLHQYDQQCARKNHHTSDNLPPCHPRVDTLVPQMHFCEP